ncbi:MAG: hypothetical protein PHZ14_06150 [Sulfuricella sp.]|jgi:hypothetical protein|nr:hypothetical protein [Sulfuricella sp.]
MNERILNVKVGEPLESSLARAARTMEALGRGEMPAPYFGAGFADIGQLFAVFTPRRWDLLAVSAGRRPHDRFPHPRPLPKGEGDEETLCAETLKQTDQHARP